MTTANSTVAAGFSITVNPGATQLIRAKGKLILALPRLGLTAQGEDLVGEPQLVPTEKTLKVASTGGFADADFDYNGQQVRFNANVYVWPPRNGCKLVDDTLGETGPVKFQVPAVGSAIKITRQMVIVAFDEENAVAAAPEPGKKMIRLGYVDLRYTVQIGGQPIGGNVYVGFYPPRGR